MAYVMSVKNQIPHFLVEIALVVLSVVILNYVNWVIFTTVLVDGYFFVLNVSLKRLVSKLTSATCVTALKLSVENE
jgi:hypothetical protein